MSIDKLTMPLKTFTAKNFFDRNNELEVLKGVASEALAGDASDIFLSARSGIGKTELLRHLFNHLFRKHNYVIPFFYTINTSYISAEDFSKDYLGEFIIQSLAYLKKDYSMIDAGIYSLENIIQLAKDSEAWWAVEIIENHMQIEANGDPIRLFLHAVSAPYHCYLNKGMPVLVMIDNFHKAKELCELAPGDNKNLWLHFEKIIKSRYTPHIFTGFQAELNRMFFEETSFGEHLELINLSGLSRDESIKFFASLCELYGLNVSAELLVFIDTFNGNPFYIKSFAQAVRQTGRTFSEDDFLEIYFDEITNGKIYRYWTTRLKTHILQLDLRKPSLNFLNHLCGNNTDVDFLKLSESLSVEREELDYIISLLHSSGVVETGFSLTKLADDQILVDVVKGLYHREIQREPVNRIKDLIIGDKSLLLKTVEAPSFDITIPSAPKSELVAIKLLQQIAQHFNIPSDATGQVQIALVELFTNILKKNRNIIESYDLKFKLKENIFSVEITTPQEDFAITDDDSSHVREYIDNLRVERIMKGTKITLLKELRGCAKTS